MKRSSKISLFIIFILLCLCATAPLWRDHFFPRQANEKIVHRKKNEKKKIPRATWGYPFKACYHKKIKFKSGQEFGHTDFLRRLKPKSYFHDGFDFGFSEVGHKNVYAVHAGTVHKVKFRPGMDLYVWVISPDGYVEIYQEGFLSITDIAVKKGQKIKLGQKIGRLTGSHLHLGITKTDKDYIDKHGDPCRNWWKDNGTWLNPMKIINHNLKKDQQPAKND